MMGTAPYKPFDRFRSWILVSVLTVGLSPVAVHANAAATGPSGTVPSPSAGAVEVAPSNIPAEVMRTTVTDSGTQGKLSAPSSPDGSIVLATVQLPNDVDSKNLSASIAGTKGIPFYPLKSKGGHAYQAVIPVPFNHKPGSVKIRVELDGEESAELPFEITDGHYRAETLKVDEKKVVPPKNEMKRIIAEQTEIRAIYDHVTPEKFWHGPFSLPVNSIVTSPFGSKRVYNGEMKSFHQGCDFRAKIGTPIHAPAGGIVVLAKNLYFTGNTVLIDHGYGIFTIYGHMSQLKVQKGDRVDAQAVLGLSGMTGRANGPHLHWGAVVHHQKVDPIYLTKVME